jgi:hypothetical protein
MQWFCEYVNMNISRQQAAFGNQLTNFDVVIDRSNDQEQHAKYKTDSCRGLEAPVNGWARRWGSYSE